MDVLHAKSSADANQILAIVPFQAFNMNLQDDSMVQHPETLGHLSFLTNEDELHTDYKSAVIAFGMVKVLEAIRDCIPPVSWCNHSLQSCKKCDLFVIYHLMMERLDLVGLIIGNQATRTHTVPRKSNQTFVALLFRLSFIVNAFHSHACVFISFSSFPCLALPCLAFLCYDTIDAIRES
jgi:hypothetical protein